MIRFTGASIGDTPPFDLPAPPSGSPQGPTLSILFSDALSEPRTTPLDSLVKPLAAMPNAAGWGLAAAAAAVLVHSATGQVFTVTRSRPTPSSCLLSNSGRCVTDGTGRYGNNERCVYTYSGPATVLEVIQFEICDDRRARGRRDDCDDMRVDGVRFNGRSSPPIQNGSIVQFSSDDHDTESGYTLCALPAGVCPVGSRPNGASCANCTYRGTFGQTNYFSTCTTTGGFLVSPCFCISGAPTTVAPTSDAPTRSPTDAPTRLPTASPTGATTSAPTAVPTIAVLVTPAPTQPLPTTVAPSRAPTPNLVAGALCNAVANGNFSAPDTALLREARYEGGCPPFFVQRSSRVPSTSSAPATMAIYPCRGRTPCCLSPFA